LTPHANLHVFVVLMRTCHGLVERAFVTAGERDDHALGAAGYTHPLAAWSPEVKVVSSRAVQLPDGGLHVLLRWVREAIGSASDSLPHANLELDVGAPSVLGQRVDRWRINPRLAYPTRRMREPRRFRRGGLPT
jgi:hypothetical protein